MKTKHYILFIFSFFIYLAQVEASTKIACSHPELCRLAKIIFAENNVNKFEFESLIQIKGDPHEFEPSALEIKNLIKAEILISGPLELNPWIKKVNYQRTKNSNLKTINITLDKKDYALYPGAGHEALSHFWLYPKIFCSLKNSFETQLVALKFLNVLSKNNSCSFEEQKITNTLKLTISKLQLPIVLTHDALLPLLETISSNENSRVVAIKGSGHHQEASPTSVKKLYDALEAPKVVWVVEDKIHVPKNILAKKRSQDLIINIDTANSDGLQYFQILQTLNDKLLELIK